MQLHAREGGAGSSIAVFLHGFGGSGAVWDAVEPLVAKHARTLVYDLPGHGRSADHGEWTSPRRMASAIGADIERRELKRIHLVGHSLGGAIATLMASAQPAWAASLTLVAPGGMGRRINAPLLRRFAAATDEAALAGALQAMHGPRSQVAPGEIAAHLAWRAVAGNRDRLAQLAGRITPEGEQGAFPGDMLAALAMPVSVLWGRNDDVVPVEQAGDLPEGFDVHVLEDAGHMLPQERPDVVAELVAARIAPASSDESA